MSASDFKLAEFETALASACEAALREVLGASAAASTVIHLSREGVALTDCATRPESFDDALSTPYNPAGALFLEGRILKRFYKTFYANDFSWGNGLNFLEEVERARGAFLGRQSKTAAAVTDRGLSR